jgi:hypothetical protein
MGVEPVEILPDITNDLLMWNALVGVLLPMVIAFVNQAHWSPTAKGIVSLILAIVAAGGTAWFNGAFTGRGVLSSILVVATLAYNTYRTFWQPSGIAPAFERATTPGNKAPRAHTAAH